MQETQETWVLSLGWEDPLEKEMATPVFLPGKFQGQRNLVGYSPWVTKSQTRLSTHTKKARDPGYPPPCNTVKREPSMNQEGGPHRQQNTVLDTPASKTMRNKCLSLINVQPISLYCSSLNGLGQRECDVQVNINKKGHLWRNASWSRWHLKTINSRGRARDLG